MGACVIFCAGGFSGLLQPIGPRDYVIAADGGLVHTQSLGLTPHAVLGDFDSLGYVPQGANVFPVEKDDTDTMLAVRRGLEEGCRRFWLYGSLDGPRLDHTVANFQVLKFLADRGCWGCLVGQDTLATVIQNGSLTFPAGCRGTISVFCIGPDAQGVTERGLFYPLEDAVLTSGFPLGTSNHFTDNPAEISVRQGSLLVLWQRQLPVPTWHTEAT